MLQILITTICTILSYKHLNSIILCVKFFRVRREKCRVLRFSSSPLSFFLSFFLLFLFIFFFRYSTVRVNFMVINTFQCTDTLSGNTGLSFYTHQKKRKKRKKKKKVGNDRQAPLENHASSSSPIHELQDLTITTSTIP